MTAVERLRDLRSGLKARLYGGPNDPGRGRRSEPERVVHALALVGGERVVDLGAGGGYYTLRLARAVGPTGVVYAVDLDPGLLGGSHAKPNGRGSRTCVRSRAPQPSHACPNRSI